MAVGDRSLYEIPKTFKDSAAPQAVLVGILLEKARTDQMDEDKERIKLNAYYHSELVDAPLLVYVKRDLY